MIPQPAERTRAAIHLRRPFDHVRVPPKQFISMLVSEPKLANKDDLNKKANTRR